MRRPDLATDGAASSDRQPAVLVVEDDASVAQTFARILRLSGYDVLIAADGSTALQHVDVLRPDAVLLDLHTPSPDGLSFLRLLRRLECGLARQTPVAVITGDYMLDDACAEELARLGATVYFKPVWLEDLLAIARQLLLRAD
jgi:CheY-like chemotaxis protein